MHCSRGSRDATRAIACAAMASLAPSFNDVHDTDNEPREPSLFAILDPRWSEAFWMAGLLGLYIFGQSYGGLVLDAINIIGPILFSLALILACYQLIISSSFTLWVPLLWYRVSMLTYFGVGSAIPAFVNDETRDLMFNFYYYYPKDLNKLSLIICLFHLFVVIISKASFAMIVGSERGATQDQPGWQFINQSNFSMVVFGSIFLVTGMTVNLFMVLPASLGFYTVPGYGSLANLSLGSLLGYFLLTLWSLQNRSNWLYVIIFLSLIESLIGLLLMTKFITLFPTVMIGLGFIFHKTSRFRLIIFAVTMVFIFTTLAPIVGYARNTLQRFYAGTATVSETVDIYRSYFDHQNASTDYAEVQDGWMRLSYTNAGTFAINQYDVGLPGDSYRYLPIVLIPRIIYPSKPNITDVSKEFTFAVNGNINSSTNPGIPAESYWNLGWWGPMLVGSFLGIILTYWSIYSFVAFSRDAWHLFFVVLFGMRTASRMDGALVADIVGPLGIAILAHLLLEFLNRFLPRRKLA
jgi:hypothetical protein